MFNKIENFLKKCSGSHHHSDDLFMIKFKENNGCHTIRGPLCIKRVIFSSLIGLFQTYRQCPPYILYSSLLIIPFKKNWIYSPKKYTSEIHSVSGGVINLQQDTKTRGDFFEFLKWKDAQSLVFFAKDEYEITSNVDHLIHPFWYRVSQKLSSLYDPTTSGHYEPLELDPNRWSGDVLNEMYFVPLKYKNIKMIFDTSNPKSFCVIKRYPDDMESDEVFVKSQQADDDDSDAQSNDEWCIAEEYLSSL